MKITIDDISVEVAEGTTVLEAARKAGVAVPSLCYVAEVQGVAGGGGHRASCMVCVVRDRATGAMIPSCSTVATEGMAIDTASDDVRLVRRLSLELLLSDHRADCLAPCTMVCPHGLDVERMLRYWDDHRRDRAGELVAEAFDLPRVACDECKAPCEKACRRRLVAGEAVEIREIVRILAIGARPVSERSAAGLAAGADGSAAGFEKNMYQSRVGVFSDDEAAAIGGGVTTDSGCLHCACRGRDKCSLRRLATDEGIKRSRYGLGSALRPLQRQQIGEKMWFEPAKCVRCGVCVRATSDGFTFSGRGFGMQIVLPEKSRANVGEDVAALCPTGAIYLE